MILSLLPESISSPLVKCYLCLFHLTVGQHIFSFYIPTESQNALRSQSGLIRILRLATQRFANSHVQ